MLCAAMLHPQKPKSYPVPKHRSHLCALFACAAHLSCCNWERARNPRTGCRACGRSYVLPKLTL